MTEQKELDHKIDRAFEFASRQLHNLVVRYPDEFPTYTQNGRWAHQDRSWTKWTEGFVGGQLWLIYRATGDEWFRLQAEHYSRLVEPRKTDRDVHDLGFIFWLTWKPWYDLSGDPAHNRVVIEAGKTLAERFQEKGGYLCSFQGAESLYIDIMMNVGLVFYAAQQEQDERLLHIAKQHCLTTRRRLVRGDGSTAHEGLFDVQTGEFLNQSTRQGWRADSTWARGLAWAMYGFATAYQFCSDPRFLGTAELIADFYLEKTPIGEIPPNDWDEPDPAYPYESSAATIAASGLLLLADLTGNSEAANRYSRAALLTVDTLLSPRFLAVETPGWEGLLKHGIYHLPANAGVDESMIWGDYYFLEALWKIKNK